MTILGFILIILGPMIVFAGIFADSIREGGPTGPMSRFGLCFIIPVIVCFVAGIVMLIVGLNSELAEYNQKTQQLCQAKHGVVSQTDAGDVCIVDDKAVQFEPGIWTR